MTQFHRETSIRHSVMLSLLSGCFACRNRDECHGPIVEGVNRTSARADPAIPPGVAPLSVMHGVVATWWYTAASVVLFEIMFVLFWFAGAASDPRNGLVVAVMGVGGLLWIGSTLPLLAFYRHRTTNAPLAPWPLALFPVLTALAFGAAAGFATESWLVGAVPLAQSLMLLNWLPGVRMRVTIFVCAALAVLAYLDAQIIGPEDLFTPGRAAWFGAAFISVSLPAMTVISLWWWDVLITLDRARASESRLAATQERLRIATDVHDLQGHHLQVIALQLELTERLMPTDPSEAFRQLRIARTSVDEARQGTRDLATRFRGVPLRDEIANATDLLTAAGIDAQATVSSDANAAPSSVLGPVIRETTTNVLRHGGGRMARLSLQNSGSAWTYTITNDVADGANSTGGGSGLSGIDDRIAEVGGSMRAETSSDGLFTVTVSVPNTKESTA